MVPSKINKEKLKLKQAQQANTAAIKLSAQSSSKGTASKKNSGVDIIAPLTTTTSTQSAANLATDLTNTTEEDEATNGKQMVGGCCVCADDTGYSNNLLVYCDGCDVAVHQGCYGIINIPEGDWFCRRCEHLQKYGSKDSKQVCCQLCAATDGAIKRTDGNKWAHVVCALFIPEISFGSNRSMEPIVVKDIMPERLNKRCSICEMSMADSNELDGSWLANPSEVGDCAATALEKKASYTTGHAYVNCNKQGCKHWFHVTCAQAKGLLCEDHSVSQNNVTYCIYCRHHFSKLTSSDIKRIPPFKSQTSLPAVAPSPKPKTTKQASKRKSLKEPTSTAPRPTTPTTTDNTKQTKKTRTSSSANDPVNSKVVDQPTANPSNVLETDKKIIKTPQRPSRSNSLNNSLSEPEQIVTNNKKMTKQSQPTNTNKLNIIKSEPDTTVESKPQPKQLSLDSIKKEKQPLIPNPTIADTKTHSLLELAVETNLASDTNTTAIITKPMEPNNEIINKAESKAQTDELDSTKRKRAELTEEQLSNQINTPSSSYSSSSSTYSIKSPSAQKRQRTKVPNLELSSSNSGNRNSSASKLDMSIVNPQAAIPLTPPPSVTQENSLGFASMMENKFADAFSRSSTVTHVEATTTKMANGLPTIKDSVTYSKADEDMNENETDESEDEDGEFPKTLEELLTKQWALGAELIAEQSQGFDVMDFVSLLNDCKRENEALAKQLSDLEKSHCDLLKQNEKLKEPLNKPASEKPKTDSNQPLKNQKPPPQQSSSFQPISAPEITPNPAQLVLPNTPVKQSISSLLISASPISSASSPNNSSLQNISFVTNSPASTQKNSQQSAVIKNNTINNTSINNNINLISQADSCFYNLSSVNKLNGLKNVNLNYQGNMGQQNNRNEASSMDLLASQYQMSSQHNPHAHRHSQNHHLASALSELTKVQIAQNESPSKHVNNKNTPTNTQMQSIQHQKQMHQQQQQQQHLQQALFNMNPYQQQLYYAYLMQQQQAGGSSPIPMDPTMLIPGLVPNTAQADSSLASSNPNSSNANNNSNSNSSKSMSSISKSIIESTLSNIISKS